MTILLDESVPRLIKTHLAEFAIATVQEMGWSGMRNGQLLAAASQQFTIFITADQSFVINKNLTGNQLSIIVLPSNQVPMVMTLLPTIRETLMTIQPGTHIELSMP